MNDLIGIKVWKSILRDMNESALLKEETIKKEIEKAKIDKNIQKLLEAIYLEEDREVSLKRFCESQEFKTLFNEILRQTDGNLNAKICEVGAGPGFLAVALAKSGFKNVCMLEPNGGWITGTGFIANTAKKYDVHIWNDLNEWYESDDLYDYIITKACVHHFGNVSKVAAEIGCKIKVNGKWLMFDEYFANTTKDLYSALVVHSHVIKYGQYEWPYPASLYVDMVQLVGFSLDEVVPTRYMNNYIARNTLEKVRFTKLVTNLTKILIKLKMTVFMFNIERLFDRSIGLSMRFRLFTFPQLLVFRRSNIIFPIVPFEKLPSPELSSK